VKRLIIILIFFWAGQLNNCSAQWIQDSTTDIHIKRGILFVYNLSFDSARTEFLSVTKSYPEHPAGHFFLAMVEWWRIATNLDNKSNDNKFIGLLDKVIDICDERLDKNENDITGLFFKGGALGFQGRLYGIREDWLKAANCGREALPVVMKAYELAPNNNDVLLGIGIYNYYASVIPDTYPWVKPLMFFLPKGDKIKGIEQLRSASAKARYANIEATYFLMQVLHNFEKQFPEASKIAIELHNQFPNNVLFHKYLGRTYSNLNNWNEVIKIYNDILERNSAKMLGYDVNSEREANFFLGTAMLETAKYDSALTFFYRADELCRKLDTKETSGTMVFTNLRIGMIYDIQGKRNLAIMQYRKVLDMKEHNDSYKLAEQYIKTPYQK
jgi:tetratricopeptide (TPR) repeat protein